MLIKDTRVMGFDVMMVYDNMIFKFNLLDKNLLR